MVIDAREKCESLGIDYRDYSEATKISGRMFYDAIELGDYDVDRYIDIIKSLPEKLMVALIRYDGLYKRYPKVFDFDGPHPGRRGALPVRGQGGRGVARP